MRSEFPISLLDAVEAKWQSKSGARSTFAERGKMGTITYRRVLYLWRKYSLLYILNRNYGIACVRCILDGAGARKQESKGMTGASKSRLFSWGRSKRGESVCW